MAGADADDPIGFLGLGALGTPIATNLLASGRALTVWNRTTGKTKPLLEKGAKGASKPSEATAQGGVVFSILWDDASLAEIVQSEGFLDALGPGGVHVSMTTVTPQTARAMAKLHEERGSTYVEAPIFGGPVQAAARQLIVCLAGPDVAKRRVRPLLDAMGAARVFDFGDAIGAGSATKLVGNFMIISASVAMQEAFNVLCGSGVDPRPTLEMLTTTLLPTPGNQRTAARLLGDQPKLASGIPLKDVCLFQRFGDGAHTPVPLARQVRDLLATDAERSKR